MLEICEIVQMHILDEVLNCKLVFSLQIWYSGAVCRDSDTILYGLIYTM